ncbi:MAG: M36 family metallopeptidase [Caldilineales bacterium]|nr:M36 family metallopeptidase [Caldilineales bacterium]MDW8317207.1 M36 family metallopeptidase [Anaerolineae bacterium]
MAVLRSLLVALLLTSAFAPAPVAAQAAVAGSQPLPCAEVVVSPLTGVPTVLRGCNPPAAGEADPAAAARAFLERYAPALGLADAGELALLSVRHGLSSAHVRFQQTVAGLPVLDAYVSVHLDRNGRVQVVHSSARSRLAVDPASIAVSAEQAAAAAKEAVGLVRLRREGPPPELVVLAEGEDVGRLAWRVMLLAAEPQGDWEVLVDAVTGAAIKRYNRLIFNRAQVFMPNPVQQLLPMPSDVAQPPALQAVVLQGLDGSGWLRGEYVDVTAPRGYLPATAFAPDGKFLYQPGDPRFEEVMVYYHLDATQRYLQSLGYSNRNTPPNGIRDRVTHASPHWFAHDQSFYSISDDALHFGDGGVPDAQDADIIVHEYAHALHHDQVVCWGGGEMAAIGEGFADYLAASRFADVGSDPACIGEWDSYGYSQTPPYCLRRVDRDLQYPVHFSGDPHADGQLWSRVLWDVRQAAGPTVGDTLALEANFYMPCGATLEAAGRALLDADQNLFDGAHREAIVKALAARGLWPLPAPAFLEPAQPLYLAPGSPLAIRWTSADGLAAAYELQYSLDADAVGERAESFAAGRLPPDFLSYGNQLWRTAGGAAQAGAVGHGQSSSLALEVDAPAGGRLSFRYRVSSEPGRDFFEALVDGQTVLRASGETPWTTFEVNLTPGPHVITWRYRKDSTVSAGQDSAWLDEVRLSGVRLAQWRPIGLPAGGQTTAVVWPTPETGGAVIRLRVRARLGQATGPWQVSPVAIILGEPTALRVGSFGAEQGRQALAAAGWSALALAAVALLGVARRRRP